MGSFKYINDLASRDNLTKFLEMVDPLAEWREELNIRPVTDGVFSWYTRPALAAAVA